MKTGKNFVGMTAFFSVLSALALLPGCALFEEEAEQIQEAEKRVKIIDEVKYVISVHEVQGKYSKPELMTEIPSFFGGKINVMKTPLIYSNNIQKIEQVERPNHEGYYNLRLYFTPEGKKLWTAISTDFSDSELAVIVDGEFYRVIKPRQFYSDTADNIILDGPFGKVIAERIQDYSEYNYSHIGK